MNANVSSARWGSVLLVLLCASHARAASDQRLIDAVRGQRWDEVGAMVKQVDVNARQPDGATALLWTAQWNHLPTAEVLVRAGADVNAANEYGVTPLFFAATNGSAPMTELLLQAGANPNAALPTGETALMTAVRTGQLATVQALLARGADVGARERDLGQTALMWALSERHLEVARLLIERGADVRVRSLSGFTPLLFAARQGMVEGVKLLIARGADVNEAASDGMTPLMMATIRGYVSLAELLLEMGADPNPAGMGFTPLHWAAGTWESATSRDYRVREWVTLPGLTGDVRIRLMTALLARGANPNARATRNPPRFGSSAWKIHGGGSALGATPFFFAAAAGDAAAMRFLLAQGADPHLATNDRTTPLIAAAGLGVEESETLIPESSHLDAVMLMLDLGADLHEANNQGNMALHGAAFIGYSTIAQLLVARGAELNARNKLGQTPYKIASGITVTQMFFQHPAAAAMLRQLGGVE